VRSVFSAIHRVRAARQRRRWLAPSGGTLGVAK
jgi:hypothetical protein